MQYINDNLSEMLQVIFKAWFVDFQPFERGAMISSEIGYIPSGWNLVPLGDLCKVITKGTTPTTLKRQFTNEGINFIKAESILSDHSFDLSKFAFIDDSSNTLLNRSIIAVNDILFTIAGTLGRFAYVDASILPANTNQAVAIIRADEQKINPIALYSYFWGNWHVNFYKKRVQQAVQANLSLTTIKSLPILLPPKKILTEYVGMVTPIFNQICHNSIENRKLSETRDRLLPKLMSGELSVAEI